MTLRRAIAAALLSAALMGSGALAQGQAGDVPQALAVGDFNRDGRKDLAVANAFSDNVSILLGTADGGFQKVRDIPVGIGNPNAPDDLPRDVAAGDLDGDGFDDLVVGAQGFFFTSPSVTILLGLGDPAAHFSLAGAIPLNSNGTPPQEARGATASARALPGGRGANGFASPVALGDFNGDGAPDVAVGLYGPAKVFILPGDGAGGFGLSPLSILPIPNGDFGVEDLLALDLDRDGYLDLLGVTERRIFAIRGGQATFAVSGMVASPNSELSGLAAGDFDGDGRLDVAATDRLGGVRIYRALRLNGTFEQPVREIYDPALQSASDLAPVDWDGDGVLELAVSNLNQNQVVIVAANVPAGTHPIREQIGVGGRPREIALADLDRNGLLDLLTANEGDQNEPMNPDVSVAPNLHELPALPLNPTDGLIPLIAPDLAEAGLDRVNGLGAALDGRFWAANWHKNVVVEVGPAGDIFQVFNAAAWNISQVSDIAPGPGGGIAFVTDRTSALVRRIDLNTGALLGTLDFNVGQEPGDIGYRGVAWDQAGNRLYLASPPGFSAIVVGSPAGQILDLILLDEPAGDLAFDPIRQLIFAVRQGGSRVLAYAPDGQRQPLFDIDLRQHGPQFGQSRAAAAAFGGFVDGGGATGQALLVASANHGLFRFEPFSGQLMSARNIAPGASARTIGSFEGPDGEFWTCFLDLGDPPAIIVGRHSASFEGDPAGMDEADVYHFTLDDATSAGLLGFQPGAVCYSPQTGQIVVTDQRKLLAAFYSVSEQGAAFDGFQDFEAQRPLDLRSGPILGAAVHPETGALWLNVDGQILALPTAPAEPPRVVARLSVALSPGDLSFGNNGELLYSLADAPALGKVGEPTLTYLEPSLFESRGPGGLASGASGSAALVNDPATGRLYSFALMEQPQTNQGLCGILIR
jgi:hypothetical protein